MAPDIGLLPRLGLALGGGLAAGQPAAACSAASLRRTPLAIWGMVVAHFGVAVALLGMASDSAFTQEKLAAARPGEPIEVGPWLVEFRDVMPIAGPNWTALEAELRASRGGGRDDRSSRRAAISRPADRPPTKRRSTPAGTASSMPCSASRTRQGRWQLRLWWKPFVTLIWLGGALIALGGLLALIGRLVRERARSAIRGEEAFDEPRAPLPAAARVRCCSSARWHGG